MQLNCFLVFIIALTVGYGSAQAMSASSSEWRQLDAPSAEDRVKIRAAVMEVLNSGQVGAQSRWQGTKQMGHVSLLRVYQKDGRDCSDVEQVRESDERWRYVFSYCRFPDGTWKMVP